MAQDNTNNWAGKKAYLQFLKEKVRLTYVGSNINIESGLISFRDRYGKRFTFRTEQLLKIEEVSS